MTVQRPAFRTSVALAMEGYKERMADNIRKAREAKALGPGEVADKIGVSARTVERWEGGESAPQRPNLRKLAELFGVEVDDLRPDLPPDAETLERIEAKLDLLLANAGLPTQFDEVVEGLERTIAELGQPATSTESRTSEQPPASGNQ